MNTDSKEKNHSSNYLNYILVWFALMIFTGLTVAIAGVNLGKITIATAMLIATIKAYLVLSIFMHLKSESLTFKVFVGVSLFFLFVSFALLFADYSFM